MAKQSLSQARLREVLSYDTKAGIFKWRRKRCNVKKGDVAGGISSQRYLKIGIDGKSYLAHRLAWFYIHGVWPNNQIDHINHVRHDNRLCNLRLADQTLNNRNMSMNKNNKSGVMGVHFSRSDNMWVSYIKIHGNRKHIGMSKDYLEVVCMRKSAESKYGFHENHGVTL